MAEFNTVPAAVLRIYRTTRTTNMRVEGLAGGREDYLEFALQEGFSDGYENDLKEVQPEQSRTTHPMQILFKSGKVRPFSIKLDLYAGVGAITTPSALKGVVERLFSLCLSGTVQSSDGKALEKELATVMVAISSGHGGDPWFIRRCLPRSVRVDWKPPYDARTGIPYRAEVELELLANYSSSTASHVPVETLPRSPWTFSRMWGRDANQSLGKTAGPSL